MESGKSHESARASGSAIGELGDYEVAVVVFARVQAYNPADAGTTAAVTVGRHLGGRAARLPIPLKANPGDLVVADVREIGDAVRSGALRITTARQGDGLRVVTER